MRYLWAVLLLGPAVAGCGTAALSESQEYYVGRGVAAGAIAESPLNPDLELEKYVAMVGYTIAFESDRPETFKGYHFGVLRNDAINAFAAPSGFVFVTTGALKHMQNEDELAAVLAHEVAHVNLRHPEASANRASAKAGVLDTLGEVAKVGIALFAKQDQQKALGQLVEGFGKVLDELAKEIVNGYGREDELKADAFAVDLLARSGVRYDPGALKTFVARLPKMDRGAWSTHPELEGRIQGIEQEVAKLKNPPGIDPSRTQRFLAATAGLRGP